MQATKNPAKATRASRLVDDLREAILSGDLRPGAKLNLDRMRESHHVSLSPLREALARLTSTGLVQFEDQRGYRTTEVSAANLAEITRLRSETESLAAGIAAQTAGLDWEAAVMAALHRLNRADPTRLASWQGAHTDFHQTLVDGAGLPILSEFCRMLLTLGERYRRLCGDTAPHDMVAQYAAIAEAAAVRRDADRARQLLRDQINHDGALLMRRFQTYTPKRTPSRSSAPDRPTNPEEPK
ncbi:GntR family transcriptional regulator [Defluviimonas sp. WL0002]|uniref:GntR family transcriptional regulator n=1 Tax=Albidovulum marisflavi TaxID=2984159 RepID=A0ABT2ZEQ7_9RHOB|nr:GntR family transcriptional regulator [Defluviimonas sp. WL0002]MCV2869633.1 GntR family transcriptional regulator [Defluviimonas sp. WL0002]